MVELSVVTADITTRACDLLVLKHADGFSGVDGVVSKRLAYNGDLESGQCLMFPGQNVSARNVMFFGVSQGIRYPGVRTYARSALERAADIDERIAVVCTTSYGPEYGLDERESFLCIVGGFLDAMERHKALADLKRIEIVEDSVARMTRLHAILAQTELGVSGLFERLSSFGGASEQKPKLFVAMPFAPELSDVWEIAIQEACQAAGIMCERLDNEAFTGDMLAEMKARVRGGCGVLGVLDNANPNVFLEIGFAWGTGKPTVLVAKKGAALPFDIQGQKCLHYTSINNLRALLTTELKALTSQGVFD